MIVIYIKYLIMPRLAAFRRANKNNCAGVTGCVTAKRYLWIKINQLHDFYISIQNLLMSSNGNYVGGSLS